MTIDSLSLKQLSLLKCQTFSGLNFILSASCKQFASGKYPVCRHLVRSLMILSFQAPMSFHVGVSRVSVNIPYSVLHPPAVTDLQNSTEVSFFRARLMEHDLRVHFESVFLRKGQQFFFSSFAVPHPSLRSAATPGFAFCAETLKVPLARESDPILLHLQ